MKRYILVLTLCTAAAFVGCYKDNEEELYPQTGGNCDLSNTTYSATVSNIISTNCATTGCHVAGAQAPDLSTYNGVKNNIDRVKVRAIDQRTMPAAAPLSSCNIQQLQQWINNGALNN